MGAVVHGRAGHSVQQLDDDWQWAATPNARRGAFFEQRVAQVLHHWLTGRPDEIHVFHDLVGLTDVVGAGLDPASLGGSNIDHLVLTGSEWLMIDAKGCGAGSLRVESGKGMLVRPDGSCVPRPWMDNRRAYARAGVPYRLTEGKGGVAVWVLPQATAYDHPSVARARFLASRPEGSRGEMCLVHNTEIAAGRARRDPAHSRRSGRSAGRAAAAPACQRPGRRVPASARRARSGQSRRARVVMSRDAPGQTGDHPDRGGRLTDPVETLEWMPIMTDQPTNPDTSGSTNPTDSVAGDTDVLTQIRETQLA